MTTLITLEKLIDDGVPYSAIAYTELVELALLLLSAWEDMLDALLPSLF